MGHMWEGPALGGAGPNWNNFGRTRIPVCRIGRGAQLGAIGPIGLRTALNGGTTQDSCILPAPNELCVQPHHCNHVAKRK